MDYFAGKALISLGKETTLSLDTMVDLLLDYIKDYEHDYRVSSGSVGT